MTKVPARLIAIVLALGVFLALNAWVTRDLTAKIQFTDDRHFGIFAWIEWVFSYYELQKDLFDQAILTVTGGFTLTVLIVVLWAGFVERRAKKLEDSHGTAHFANRDEVMAMGLIRIPPPISLFSSIFRLIGWLWQKLFTGALNWLAPELKESDPNATPDRTTPVADGVYCGAYRDPKTDRVYYLRHSGPEHICALAPTRSGKGVGLVIPTLLSWPHSVFVLDFKGENWAITSGWRSQPENAATPGPGTLCLRFDPAQPYNPELPGSCKWNPLDEIRFQTIYQVGDAQNIALMVVDDDGKGIAGNHFRSAAFELILGLILYGLYKAEGLTPKKPNKDCTASLATIAQMLVGTGPLAADKPALEENPPEGEEDRNPQEGESHSEQLKALWSEMTECSILPESDYPEDDPRKEAAEEAEIVIQSVGNRMANTPFRELGSIVSTANNALMLYRDPIVARNTNTSTFLVAKKEGDSLPSLMDSDQPMSLYLVVSPNNIDRLRPLMRLLLTQIVLRLAGKMEFEAGRAVAPHTHRLLLLLDEFPVLGKLDIFESALAYIAGYQIKAYLITQDVQQLFKHYSTNESIISNCHIRIAYAPNKIETAEWISKMAGTTTVVKKQVSESGKRFGMLLEQVSTSFQEHQRPLITPDEVMRLKGPEKAQVVQNNIPRDIIKTPGDLLVFVAGQPVIRGLQILYFQDPVFSKRAQMGPRSAVSDASIQPQNLRRS